MSVSVCVCVCVCVCVFMCVCVSIHFYYFFQFLFQSISFTNKATVIKTRSTETMNFNLCLMGFVVSISWAYYGYLLEDNFVMVS